MVEMDERETVLGSLKGYLAELLESGVDELPLTAQPVAAERARSVAPRSQEARAEAPPPPRPETVPAPPAPEEREGVTAPEEPCRIEGHPQARLLFVMHGSGFSGEAGGLLEKIVAAMGFSKEEVCLLSLPPGGVSRAALASRVASLAPEVVVSMGEEATSLLLQSEAPLQRLRGRFHDLAGIPLMPTHHPEAMLENQGLKRDAWNDMQKVMGRLGKGR
ncbi:uracil-DNA glycosylase [Geoanaerobacter pelophilus]|uniref:Uracil-DNA glycosylase n=1 Tax=Geoanaerobacter pelophilus TaxID=60036 RepID=A0ABQ0MFL7_9BACT|nr:uracil-DNA glycosylase family protein [Geoanaerobacter pelophilus]GAW65886.1 uracil-DNA glycosylase [Geoanaerobacter pelophilus]